MILNLRSIQPKIPATAFIAPDAWVIEDVEIGELSSVFFGAVLRGDILPIKIGRETNLQEHVIVHTSKGRTPSIIGDQVTVGHRATIHGCKIGDRCLIGMSSTILDEAVIGNDCVVGAGSLITEGKIIPPRSLVFGSPGKVIRELTDSELAFLLESASRYVKVGQEYRKKLGSC